MRAVIDNLLEQNGELRSRLSLQAAQKHPRMLGPRNVAQPLGNEVARGLARFLPPAAAGLPLVRARMPLPGRRTRLVEHKSLAKRMRLGPPIPYAGASHEGVETHRCFP
jgi:hypothetical protein